MRSVPADSTPVLTGQSFHGENVFINCTVSTRQGLTQLLTKLVVLAAIPSTLHMGKRESDSELLTHARCGSTAPFVTVNRLTPRQ